MKRVKYAQGSSEEGAKAFSILKINEV